MAHANALDVGRRQVSPVRRLWDRRIEHYPDNGPRAVYLAIVVLATIVLYYELYIQGAIANQVIQHYGMSFSFFVYISVIGNAVGAFASLFAGLADRWGRANLVTYGLGVVGFLLWFGLPNAPGTIAYTALFSAVSFVEGIILVATPALIRDYSPQLGRASAMGFWTLGPVVGSLIVAEVSSHTLNVDNFNQQFVYAGWSGIIVFVIALIGLRELSPRIRDQLMVSLRDRALVEARAQGVDVAESQRHPWRTMMHLDVVGSAVAISIFLIIYYTMVGFLVIFFTTIFGFTQTQANSLGNWLWAFDAGGLIVFGVISDLLRVRKPLMVLGACGAIAMTVVLMLRTTQPHTSYYSFVFILSLLAVFLALAYAPWMASFTETVEKHSPALTATGLAVWGWIIRIIISVSLFALPLLITSTTPLVEHGAQVQTAAAQAGPALKIVQQHPQLFAQLAQYPPNQIPPALLQRAVSEVGVANLQLVAAHQSQIEVLSKYAGTVQQAAAQSPHQWQDWWWVCIGTEAAFIPLVFLMAGRWDPRKAKADALAHEQMVEQELASLHG